MHYLGTSIKPFSSLISVSFLTIPFVSVKLRVCDLEQEMRSVTLPLYIEPNDALIFPFILLQLRIFFTSIIVSSLDNTSVIVSFVSLLLRQNDAAAETPPRNNITPEEQEYGLIKHQQRR